EFRRVLFRALYRPWAIAHKFNKCLVFRGKVCLQIDDLPNFPCELLRPDGGRWRWPELAGGVKQQGLHQMPMGCKAAWCELTSTAIGKVFGLPSLQVDQCIRIVNGLIAGIIRVGLTIAARHGSR